MQLQTLTEPQGNSPKPISYPAHLEERRLLANIQPEHTSDLSETPTQTALSLTSKAHMQRHSCSVRSAFQSKPAFAAISKPPAGDKASLRRSVQKLYPAKKQRSELPRSSCPLPSQPMTPWQDAATCFLQHHNPKHSGCQKQIPIAHAPCARARARPFSAHARPQLDFPLPLHAEQTLSLLSLA